MNIKNAPISLRDGDHLAVKVRERERERQRETERQRGREREGGVILGT